MKTNESGLGVKKVEEEEITKDEKSETICKINHKLGKELNASKTQNFEKNDIVRREIVEESPDEKDYSKVNTKQSATKKRQHPEQDEHPMPEKRMKRKKGTHENLNNASSDCNE